MIESLGNILTPSNISFMLDGVVMTIEFALINIFFSFLLGLILALMRNYGGKLLSGFVMIYVEIFRNTPLLLWLLFARFSLTIAIGLEPYSAVVFMFVCFFASIICEQIRSGFNSISKGQFEAAASQGFNFAQSLLYIVVPQAVKKVIPQLLSTLITIIKDSSYLSTIAIADFMYQARAVMANYPSVDDKIAVYLIIVMVYFVINFTLSCVVRYLSNPNRKKRGKTILMIPKIE